MKATEIHRQAIERALKALALRRAGLTYREVGELMGSVTVETARQAVLKGERIERRRGLRRGAEP